MSNIFTNEDTNPPVKDQLVPRKDKLDRKSWNMFTIRRNTAWKDDSIPIDEIKVISQLGRGRFGEVKKKQAFFLANTPNFLDKI